MVGPIQQERRRHFCWICPREHRCHRRCRRTSLGVEGEEEVVENRPPDPPAGNTATATVTGSANSSRRLHRHSRIRPAGAAEAIAATSSATGKGETRGRERDRLNERHKFTDRMNILKFTY
uniref:Uncharacterized protein n=1 Tax=Oryza sativa subsp. japonica TaxID=39947 RepID=Q6ZFS7_ORYSJ|nr:hypothetical protein [Oryza sativa Japonica Group]